ncbi:MAG: DUF2798 domain-containing protein [Lachnospiraceae bacterium]
MPKTKFEKFIFTLLMVFCMVYLMTLYSESAQAGGLTLERFPAALRGMWAEYLFVFLLVFFVVSSVAMRLAFSFVTPGKDSPILVTLSIQCMSVCCVVPLVTLFSVLYHNGAVAGWFVLWITTAAKCFPVALLLQIFFVGPLVRAIFRLLFRKGREKVTA